MSAPTLPANMEELHDGEFDVSRADPIATTTGWTRAARTALKDEGLVRFREAVTKKILKTLISSNLNVSSYKASEMEDKNNFFNAIASWSGSSLQLQSSPSNLSNVDSSPTQSTSSLKGTLVISSTHELFGRQRVGREDGRKFRVTGKDKAKLDSGVVVVLLIEIVRSHRNPLGRTAGRSVTGGRFRGRRARFPSTRGIRVIGITHNLLEPDNTCSRDSRALATRFVELGTMAVSLIQSRRAYKTVRLLR